MPEFAVIAGRENNYFHRSLFILRIFGILGMTWLLSKDILYAEKERCERFFVFLGR